MHKKRDQHVHRAKENAWYQNLQEDFVSRKNVEGQPMYTDKLVTICSFITMSNKECCQPAASATSAEGAELRYDLITDDKSHNRSYRIGF